MTAYAKTAGGASRAEEHTLTPAQALAAYGHEWRQALEELDLLALT